MSQQRPFIEIQLWDSTLLPLELFEHVHDGQPNGSIEFWTVRGEHGPHGDEGYGPEHYDAKTLRLDGLVDAWLVEHGATPGSEIAWHIWW